MSRTTVPQTNELETDDTAVNSAPRLCNEIKLFDLCELEQCTYLSNRFCTNPELLARFEKIEERQERIPDSDDSELFDEDDEQLFDEEFTDDDEEYFDEDYIDPDED